MDDLRFLLVLLCTYGEQSLEETHLVRLKIVESRKEGRRKIRNQNKSQLQLDSELQTEGNLTPRDRDRPHFLTPLL